MRRALIAGNWKMHKSSAEAEELIREIARLTDGVKGVDIVVAPPFTALGASKSAINNSAVELSSQNIFWEEKGAFTGEISPAMLIDIGCKWAIVGHSERRQYFGETDETVNKRIKAALGVGLKPIVCVGETLEEREADRATQVIEKQLVGAFDGIEPEAFEKITIAYEPVWAIGTGRTATAGQAQEIHAFIRGWLESGPGAETAQSVRILYGGSVKPSNAAELLGQPDIDGALVGGASLKADDFSAIIRASVK